MNRKFVFIVICSLLLMNTQGFVKRNANDGTFGTTTLSDNVILQHTNQLKNCLDQQLAAVVGEVNPDKFKPVIDLAGDEVNKVLKIWTDLTAAFTPPPKTKDNQL